MAFALADLKLIGFDVDGVLTDGRIFFDDRGHEMHAFHVADGLGMVLAVRDGLLLCAVSGRNAPGVRVRLQQLNVQEIHLGVADKAATLREVAARRNIPLEQTCFVGDDVNDLSAMAITGRAFAPADAHPTVRARAHEVTRVRGGRGVLREILDAVYAARKAREDKEKEKAF
jgi:3-deoxy-D-manno-octulosonate 8-phosphate phosphatase (KDO 8-P phosphatase)